MINKTKDYVNNKPIAYKKSQLSDNRLLNTDLG